MNTNDKLIAELHDYANEMKARKSIVEEARDKYASDILNDVTLMRKQSFVANKTYKFPKKIKLFDSINSFLKKIKIVFGLDK